VNEEIEMANTRQSGKRARQNVKSQTKNIRNRSIAKSSLKKAFEAVTAEGNKDLKAVKDAYMAAVKTVTKAASKGALPKTRAARKISRMTQFIKKKFPEVFSSK
jgi:small subunit ribosomal protein S20